MQMSLHDTYVVVPADKAANNIVFVCRRYYYECLIKELGFSGISNGSTYKLSTFSKIEILANHKSFMTTLDIPTPEKTIEALLYAHQLVSLKLSL